MMKKKRKKVAAEVAAVAKVAELEPETDTTGIIEEEVGNEGEEDEIRKKKRKKIKCRG